MSVCRNILLVLILLMPSVAGAQYAMIWAGPQEESTTNPIMTQPGVIAIDNSGGDGTIDFTPTVTQGTNLTFDIVSGTLPGSLTEGSNFNTSTGQLSGAVGSSYGSGTYQLRAMNEAFTSVTETPNEFYDIWVRWHKYTSTANISDTGAVQYLSTAGRKYTLTENITSDTNGIVFGAKGVLLDLNTHSITYGNGTAVVVANGGFETGTGTTVANWDLTNAPSAAIAANTTYMYGDQVLAFTDLTEMEYIVSDDIAISEVGHEHYACVVCDSNESAQARVRVMDAVTDAELAVSNYGDATRGFWSFVEFVPANTNGVYLIVEVDPDDGQTQDASIDYVAVALTADHGIICSGTPYNLGEQNEESASVVSACTGLGTTDSMATVTNGSIIQGSSNGFYSHGIIANEVDNLAVVGVDMTISGTNSSGVTSGYPNDDIAVLDCGLTSTSRVVPNRMSIAASAISLNSVAANPATVVAIAHNTLTDWPHVGINTWAIDDLDIFHNTILSDTVATDGYGILTNGLDGFLISHNTITAPDGKSSRGILLDNQVSDISANGSVVANSVSIRERPNVEYGIAMEAAALRMRGAIEGCYANVTIKDNIFEAWADDTTAREAYGGRIAYFPASHTSGDLGLTFVDNTFTAIVDSADAAHKARALSFDGVTVDGHGISATGNTLTSNDCSLGFGSNDGSAAYGITCVDNSIVDSALGDARTHYFIRSAFFTGIVDNVVIQDSAFSGGATNNVDWIGSGVKDISLVWTITVTVTAGGSPVSGATVTLDDSGATELDSDTTDVNGQVTLSTIDTLAHGDTPLALAGCVVTASKAGYTGDSDTVTLVSTRTLSLTLVAE